ncbi:MAG TPA: DoxX family protein [Candidatus Limnocylindrales bacterium]|nr:DoxX family protein [Candidatus Limnocylindrales bacterium]
MDFDIAMLVLRVGIGTIFVAHGLQKLFGWWGGPGWEGFKGFIAYLGLKPPLFWASISLVAELGGGLALIAGVLVPLAAAGLVAQTIVLFVKVHWPNGFWASNGGIEFPLAFLVGAFAVQVLGPGEWSLDALLPLDTLYEPSVRWVILAIAVAGALVAAFWPAPPQPEGPAPTEGAPDGAEATS